MANHIGSDFTPPDVLGKVTGSARYAEDIRVDGLVYARLLTSPMPHARVRHLDVSDALALDGVVGVLTADDVPAAAPPHAAILTNEPVFVGDPVLAIAAQDDTIAANALERVHIEYEPLPFCVDPLETLAARWPECSPRRQQYMHPPDSVIERRHRKGTSGRTRSYAASLRVCRRTGIRRFNGPSAI